MFRTAPIQEYTVSLTTRTDKFSASAVAGYMNQEGIMINSGYQRYSLRLNTEYKVNDMVTVGFNIAPTYNHRYSAGTDGAFYANNLLYLALLQWPIISPEGKIGNTGLTIEDAPDLGGFPTSNLYQSAQQIKNPSNSSRLLSNGFISIEPVAGLILKQSVNIQYGNGESKLFNPSTAASAFATSPPITAFADYRSNSILNWLSETTATYSKSIGSHTFDLLGGYSVQKYNGKEMRLYVSQFPDDRISDADAATIINADNTSTEENEWAHHFIYWPFEL
jgi:hypothetical protein